MGRRQALGWLGATICSVALVIAGGLMLSSVAVHRYLQASTSAMHRGDTQDAGPTPAPTDVAAIDRVVAALTGMPGVATASCDIDTAPPSAAQPTPTAEGAPNSVGDFSYEISVIMTPDATAAQSTDVVYSMTKQLQNAHVNLELSVPTGDGHAESVVDYRNAFDAPVARSTVAAVSQAVSVATAVPGVESVHVTVPYTWNLAAGDLDVHFATNAVQQPTDELKHALARTALAGVEWSPTH
ncbi:hypothetical protein ACFOYW_07075 [Gryllotalpicola reticulitermitis]|uniref:Uncharacterized protein n=1 Tax=Gryllotalpicola reticulitermitis TaxID=1184153 RepID=A0ABV8Q3Z1_9MICO